jgi:cob(I)alamin adenosyltransferase
MGSAALLAGEKASLKAEGYLPDPECVAVIENEIDQMEAILPPQNSFILPGGNILVSYCQIARCVCRRAEREVLKLNNNEKVPDLILKFLNRLSDYLFVLSRMIGLELDIKEVSWPL